MKVWALVEIESYDGQCDPHVVRAIYAEERGAWLEASRLWREWYMKNALSVGAHGIGNFKAPSLTPYDGAQLPPVCGVFPHGAPFYVQVFDVLDTQENTEEYCKERAARLKVTE